MGINWSLYEERLLVNGATTRERIISAEIEMLSKRMLDSPALKTVSVDGVEKQMLILSSDLESEKTFKLLPGDTINIGDIILWNEMHWLVTRIDFDDELTRDGRIVQCNRQIRWQNPKSLEIIERWCLVTKPYTSNIDAGATLSVSEREFKVQLPYDAETRLLDLDKRFMLEIIDGKTRTYKCTSVDQNTNKYQDIDGGFIVLNLTQDESGRTNDNAGLMICDYINPAEVSPATPPPPGSLKCEIIGRSIVRAGLGARSYRAVFLLEDGVTEDNSIAAVWSVDIPIDKTSYVRWAPNGNLMSLEAYEEAIGTSVIIRLNDAAGKYPSAVLVVEVVHAYD